MPDLTSVSESVGALLKETGDSLSVFRVQLWWADIRRPGGGARCVSLLRGRFGGVHPSVAAGVAGRARICHGGNPGQQRTLCPAERPHHSRAAGHYLGGQRDRRQRPHRQPVRGTRAGHACIAVSGPVEKVITVETGDDDREANMWVFARAALDLLEECVREARG